MDNNNSYTYEIKKNANTKLIIISIAILILVFLLVFFLCNNNKKPKNAVLNFIDALQDYDYNKVSSYIDYEDMVMLKNTSNDFENLDKNLNNLSSLSEDEQSNFKESISYTKRYINSLVNEFKNENAILNIDDIKVSNINSNSDITKVTVKLNVRKGNNNQLDTIDFYVMKKQKNYRIIAIYGNIYF